MSWFSDLFSRGSSALEDAKALEAESRSSRAGKQQRCSYCGELGHKRPRHAPEIEAELRNTIAELEAGKAEAEERAELSAREARVLQGLIDDLRQQLVFAESIAQIATYGEGTRI